MSEPSHPTTAPTTDPAGQPSGTALLDRREQAEEAQPGDHERFAHYVKRDRIMESALSGEPVIALCGKVWVPGRDPKRFPVCPTCKEIYEGLRPGDADNSGSDG